MHFLISSTIAVYKFMNFYELNQIIEQSKVSEVVVNRPGFTATGQPVAKPAPPAGAKPAPPAGAKPAVTGAKPTVPGAKPTVPGSPKRSKIIRPGKVPPICPSFGCREPETSPKDTTRNIQNLKPDQKKKVDDLVQDLTAAK
jgi:hypothetical protein